MPGSKSWDEDEGAAEETMEGAAEEAVKEAPESNEARKNLRRTEVKPGEFRSERVEGGKSWIPTEAELVARIHDAPQPAPGKIRLSGPLEHDNIVNGDGLRAVLWTQGCPNHCKGCQNPETWAYNAGIEVEIAEICARLKGFPGQAGLTFCGGEPFVQPRACREIAEWVRRELGWNVWSFSGFTYEIIKQAGGEAWEFLKTLDALIDGPFIEAQKDLSLKFRGSRNQRLLHLQPGTGKIVSIE